MTEQSHSVEEVEAVMQEASAIEVDLIKKALETGMVPPGIEIVYSCALCEKQFKNIKECNEHGDNCIGNSEKIQQMYVDKLLEKELSEDHNDTVKIDNVKIVEQSFEAEEVISDGNKNAGFGAHFERLQRLGTVIKEQNVVSSELMRETIEDQNNSLDEGEVIDVKPDINQLKNKISAGSSKTNKREPDHVKPKTKKKSFLDRISKIAPVKARLDEEDEDRKVYEFHDVDMELRIRKAKLDVLNKKRTCPHCKELFDDPMDVLRHKRVAHAFQKKYVPAAELEKYYHVEDKSKCPICSRPIKGGFPSMYFKHLLTHKEEYSFQCKICNMMFRREDHKEQHESRHII